MKKFLIGLMLFSITSQMTAKVFLRNKYGADVYYAQKASVKAGEHMDVLHNGQQVELKNQHFSSVLPQEVINEIKSGKITNVKLRNLYKLSLATGYSFGQDVSDIIVAYIEEMQKDASKHPNDNIILTINSSWNPMEWSITPSWEPAK